MKKILLLIVLLITYSHSQAKNISKTPFEIGETIEIESKILNETRTLNIYLPQNYHSQDSIEYSVIYLLDGSANEDFLHIVGLLQFFELQFQSKPTIIVGISNVDRKRDFTFPTTDTELKKDFPTTGGSEKFIQFIKKELQPTIDKNYKTNSDKIIIGQSLGGLLATEILLKHSSLFTSYIIVSPSLWWDNESLLKKAPELIKNTGNVTVVISVGKEAKIMIREAKKLYALSKKSEKITNRFFYLKKEDHGSVLHNAVYKSFDYLFNFH